MPNLPPIEILGHYFAEVKGTENLPHGRYVSHGGKFFPLKSATRKSAEAYPFRVLIDCAAQTSNQAVLIFQAGQAVVSVSGTDRAFVLDPSNKQGFNRALVRLAMGLDNPELVVIGNADGTDFSGFNVTNLDISEIKLPSVLYSRQTLRVAGMMILFVAASFVITSFVQQQLTHQIVVAEKDNSAAMASMEELLAQREENRKLLEQEGFLMIDEKIDHGKVQPAPEPQQSFIELLEKGTQTFKVKNGKLIEG